MIQDYLKSLRICTNEPGDPFLFVKHTSIEYQEGVEPLEIPHNILDEVQWIIESLHELPLDEVNIDIEFKPTQEPRPDRE